MHKKQLPYILFIFLIALISSCLKGKFATTTTIEPAKIDTAFANQFKLQTGLTAGIGARSVSLSQGRILWLFEKSHLNDFNVATQKINCTANAHNAAIVQTGTSFVTLNNGNNDFIPSNEANAWYNPLSAYEYFDTLFVFAKKEGIVQNNKTYIAKYNSATLQFLKIDSVLMSNTIYGYNLIVDSAIGFCYVYGIKNFKSTGNNDVCLARFPINNIHATWVYYASNQWENYAQNAVPVTQVPAENFSIKKIKEYYVMITQDAEFNCNQGTTIYSDCASYPYGPFLNHTTLYNIQDKIGTTTAATKQATIHPQFTNNNELLLTYSIDGFQPCISTCANGEDEPDYYRIKAIRIPLKNINPSL